ncbi:MAG: HD-GYP domain-containing protein [Bdellovibrio sp.]|jgi:HD-GYP domain-containing protein (c-di-GMP phosphodiesterase class II)
MSHVPIRVSTLRGDQKIEFDAYVKINDKFVLYVRAGDSFEGPRLKRLKEKKLKKMFILETAERNYRRYLSSNIDMAYDSTSGKPLETRAEIIHGAQQSNAEQVMENSDSVEAYNEAKEGAARFVQFLTQEDKAVGQILNFENLDKNVAHHGVTVSTLATALAKRLGNTDPKLTQLLTLGALLHDFEHFHSGLDIARPLSQMSEDEHLIYKEHPILGGRKVQTKKHFDKTVLSIIVQHEEYIDGKGWPQGLKESQMDPLSVIVASANAVDRLLTFEGVPRKEVAKRLMLSSLGRYPLQHLQMLGDILNQ